MKRLSKFLLISVLSLILLTAAACEEDNYSAAEKQTTVAEEDVSKKSQEKDSVQEVEEEYLLTKVITEDVDENKKYVSRRKEYNDQGKLIKDVRYNKKGEVRDYEKREYNEAGKIKKLVELRNITGDKLKITRTYQYNDEGKKVSYVDKTPAGAKCGEGKYKYYEDGTLKYEYSRNIYQGRVKKIYYNKRGEKTKKIDNSKVLDMHTVSYYKREYDDRGRKVKEIRTTKIKETGEEIVATTWYNKWGESTKYIKKNGGEILTWFERKYDENGNEVKFISKDKDGKIEKIRKYTFDASGNEVQMIRKNRVERTGKLKTGVVIIKKYDDNGNEVKAIYKNEKDSSPWKIYYLKYKKIGR